MSNSEKNTKIGEGHLGAMGRLGLSELRAAAYPESNVARHGEYGLYGTLTPGEVAEARRGEDRDFHEEKPRDSVLGDRMQQAKEREPRDDRGREMDLDRG